MTLLSEFTCLWHFSEHCIGVLVGAAAKGYAKYFCFLD